MIAYPHRMPAEWQDKTYRAAVISGAETCMARAPLFMGVGHVRPHADIALAEADCDAVEAIFFRCPPHQRAAAAIACMSVKEPLE